MDDFTMMRGPFSRKRLAKAPSLSNQTVEHSATDRYVHDDLRDKATYFRQALEECPEVNVTLPDGSTERRTINAAAGMNSDIFYSYHDRRDAPRVLPGDRVKPHLEMVRQIMEHYHEDDNFKVTRSQTRGNPIQSGLATMTAASILNPIIEQQLAEEAARAEDMREQEREMEAAEQDARDANGDPGLLGEAATRRGEARERLGELAEAQNASLPLAVQRAVERAAEDAREATVMWANLPGNAPGEHSTMDPDSAMEMMRKWLDDPAARKVAAKLGRMKRDFRFKHSSRAPAGREIPVGITQGNDLPLVLPSELAYLAIPQTEILFYKRWADRALMQRKMVGAAQSGKGPIILLVDFSISMNSNDRHIGAKASGLALLGIAASEKRAVTIIAFDTTVLGEWTFSPRGKMNLQDAYEFASMTPAGGTKPLPAMLRAEEILRGAEFRQADIVIVTDGECRFDNDDLALRDRLMSTGVRIHGISIECAVTQYLGVMCSTVIPVSDLSEPNAATDHLVQYVI